MPGRALALLFVSTMAWAQCELPDTAAPVRASRAVFDRLVRAADIADRVQLAVAGADCPARQSQFEGAWFEPARRRVSLDAALYEFCAARKDATDCLAFLLGHELGHVSQTINRLSGFAGGDAKPDAAENARREADADLRGGVFGYRAGFDSLRDAPQILEAVYAKYGLARKLEGYPSLDERKAGVAGALAELRRLIPVFEAANLLLILGANDVAADCFEGIARRFRSREIYNNKGVAYALQLAALGDPKETPAYPWILDSSSRLGLTAAGSRGEGGPSREELYERGMKAFEESMRLDPDYAPARVNAACLADLYEPKSRRALSRLDDASDLIQPGSAAAGALAAAREIVMARRAGKPWPAPVTRGAEVESTEEEAIGERTPASVLRGKAAGDGVAIESDTPLQVGPAKEYGEFATLVVQRGGNRWAFVTTRTAYAGKTAHGVGLGAARTAVDKAYCESGAPCGVELRAAAGTWLHFAKARTIFLLNEKGEVASWTLYARR
ncbi:MAG: hypothetical protein JSU00_05735 [Acidobacteria bacterium]|nr:hypothetical protein [Acidobacteriota bacterium]